MPNLQSLLMQAFGFLAGMIPLLQHRLGAVLALQCRDSIIANDMNKNEAFSRVLIDAMLTAQGWNVSDPNTVRFEVVMPDNTRADYGMAYEIGRQDLIGNSCILTLDP